MPSSSSSSPLYLSVSCFIRQFLCKICLIQLALLHFIVFGMFVSLLTVCNTSSFFTQTFQFIPSNLLQHQISKYQVISDLLSEVSKFQHYTQLCYDCSISLIDKHQHMHFFTFKTVLV